MDTYSSHKCKFESCDRNAAGRDGYCKKHHHQVERHGTVLTRTSRDPNEVRNMGTYLEIDMYNRQNLVIGTMLISQEDFHLVDSKKVALAKNGYPVIKHKNTVRSVHVLVLPVKQGNYVDHINHNKLDNRRENLRETTPLQSAQNMKAVGTVYNKTKRRWLVGITVNKVRHYVGSYKTKEEAVLYYRDAIKTYFGEYAYIYEPQEA